MKIQTQLPVITGKPYIPTRNIIKPWSEDVECKDGTACEVLCYCDNAVTGVTGAAGKHTYGMHLSHAPHTHNRRVEPPANGSGWLERKASGEIVYHAPWLKMLEPKPFKMPALKARRETPAKSLERMRKECNAAKDRISADKPNSPIGKVTPDGYKITVTNGHWALCEKTDTIGSSFGYMDVSSSHKATWIEDPEFALSIKRADILAGATPGRMVCLFGADSQIVIYASDPDIGDFAETIPAGIMEPWRMALNVDYLQLALGSWPLIVWTKDEESAVILEPADKSWRFVVMPFRYELDRAEEQARNILADILPDWKTGEQQKRETARARADARAGKGCVR